MELAIKWRDGFYVAYIIERKLKWDTIEKLKMCELKYFDDIKRK